MTSAPPSPEMSNFDLDTARLRVTAVTDQIVELLCVRQELMRSIAEAKKGSGDSALPIFLPQREQDLRIRYRTLALERGIDPEIVDMTVTILLSAAKFEQMNILHRETVLDRNRPPLRELKRNLLELTAIIARSYNAYDLRAQGTHIECLREERLLRAMLPRQSEGTVVNLGCANGTHVTDVIGDRFRRVIGFDVSPDMIACALEKFPSREFFEYDLDNGIPMSDASTELLVASFGSASEVCSELWRETARVLRPGGQAYLSFYNRNALITRWWTPWSNAFTIMVNPFNDTIMVPMGSEDGSMRVFWIYERSTTEEEILSNADTHGLTIVSIESSSPLWDDKPPEFFRHSTAVEEAMRYEDRHAHLSPYLGQYLRVIVRK